MEALGQHRRSIVKEAVDRLEEKMAIGQSRRQAKQALRVSGVRVWTHSTELIHSFKTRAVYQGHIVRFVKWARSTHQTQSLMQLDQRSNELACIYLQKHLDEGKSPYTLQAERSALRLFFGNRALARDIAIPRRVRANITRSRGPKRHDRHFQPANWEALLNFLRATGLRRNELRLLCVRDIIEQDTDPDYFGQTTVKVVNGKGGKSRTVPVLAGHEQDVLAMQTGRAEEEPVFLRIPGHLDVHSYRRAYAQALYLSYAPGWALPPSEGHLKPGDYNAEAVQAVSRALGHNRKDVVLRHYIR
jgi:integrase